MNPVTHAKVLDLRSRCIQADQLRRNGEVEKADALEPSLEEIREGLIALRQDRTERTEPKTKSSKAQASIPLDLNDLFK